MNLIDYLVLSSGNYTLTKLSSQNIKVFLDRVYLILGMEWKHIANGQWPLAFILNVSRRKRDI